MPLLPAHCKQRSGSIPRSAAGALSAAARKISPLIACMTRLRARAHAAAALPTQRTCAAIQPLVNSLLQHTILCLINDLLPLVPCGHAEGCHRFIAGRISCMLQYTMTSNFKHDLLMPLSWTSLLGLDTCLLHTPHRTHTPPSYNTPLH